MSLRSELNAALGRISTPAKEVRDLMVILGEHLEGSVAGNIGPHDTWYVDPAATGTPVDGKTWSRAFTTMTAGLAACSDGDTVMLAGALTEDVTTMDDYATGPSDITIRGAHSGPRRPLWLGAGAAPIIQLNNDGWTFDNIRFNLHNSYAGILLRMDEQAGGAYATTIKNCEFQGSGATKNAIDIGMGPRTKILNCYFHEIGGTAGTAIGQTGGVPWAVPTIRVEGCWFVECIRQIYVDGVNDSLFFNNYFQARGHQYNTEYHLHMHDPGTSGYNIITGNYFGGTYSIAGGYRFEANDSCIGNRTDDIAACPSGITLGLPV